MWESSVKKVLWAPVPSVFPFIPECSYSIARDLREAQLVGGVVVARKVLWAPVPSVPSVFSKFYLDAKLTVVENHDRQSFVVSFT
jgi:hypothetical protein